MAMYETGIWQFSRSGFSSGNPPLGLPTDYLRTMEVLGPGEGLIGDSYLRLYDIHELVSLNEAYRAAEFYPGLTIFGTDGGLEAFGFENLARVVRVPFIPLTPEYAVPQAESFTKFIDTLSRRKSQSATINNQTFGMQVHEVHPIAFGGDPVDPKNKAFVPPTDHAKLCVYWNRVYRRVRSQQPR